MIKIPAPLIRFPILALALCAACAALCLSACLFDKPKEEVDLTLAHVPPNADRIRVVAVAKGDTSKVIAQLYSGAWTKRPLHFGMGGAQGVACFLRVEAYEGDFLVYMSLIPSSQNAGDPTFYPNVDAAWPGVVITSVTRDSNRINIGTEFRNAPAKAFWRLAPNTPKKGPPRTGEKTLDSDSSVFHLGTAGLVLGTYIIATLIDSANTPLSVQLPDTLLTDEALAPSGASIQILDATRVGDNVEISLDIKNFAMPIRDEPAPGRGWPMAHDARGMRLLPDFHYKEQDITHMTGPAWELDGVTTLVIALHYADSTRVRPVVAASVPVASALLDRASLPRVKIISHEIVGGVFKLKTDTANLGDGKHYHVFRDVLLADDYQRCHTDNCVIDSTVWKGATRLITAVVDATHNLYVPQSKDTLDGPF